MSIPNALKEVFELKDGYVRHCALGYTRSSNDPIHKHDVQVAAALIIRKISGCLPRYGTFVWMRAHTRVRFRDADMYQNARASGGCGAAGCTG
jgi:hypothetical protein